LLEVSFIVLTWIVIALTSAVTTTILENMVNMHFIVRTASIIVIVGLLCFFGRKAMESFWVVGTVGFYVMFAVIWVLTLSLYGGKSLEDISAGVVQGPLTDVIIDGFRYVLYDICDFTRSIVPR